jgi:hypothetical protein
LRRGDPVGRSGLASPLENDEMREAAWNDYLSPLNDNAHSRNDIRALANCKSTLQIAKDIPPSDNVIPHHDSPIPDDDNRIPRNDNAFPVFAAIVPATGTFFPCSRYPNSRFRSQGVPGQPSEVTSEFRKPNGIIRVNSCQIPCSRQDRPVTRDCHRHQALSARMRSPHRSRFRPAIRDDGLAVPAVGLREEGGGL